MILIPYLPAHLEGLQLLPAQAHITKHLAQAEYALMLDNGLSYTATHEGAVMGCGGAVDMGDGRCLAWALVSQECKGLLMLQATRLVRGYLEKTPFRRIEALIMDGHEAGHKWARLLGFENDTPEGMKSWFPDGRTAFLYARIK